MDTDWTFSSCSWLWEDEVATSNPCGSKWTREEDKAFENALAMHSNDADMWDKIKLAVPGKTIEELKLHYDALRDDVAAIDSGKVPVPCYPTSVSVHENMNEKNLKKKKESSRTFGKRGVPWTEEEHRRFLDGLEMYGKGDWKSISRHSVVTKSNSQVASHAQKYFKRLNRTKKDGQKTSINDITTNENHHHQYHYHYHHPMQAITTRSNPVWTNEWKPPQSPIPFGGTPFVGHVINEAPQECIMFDPPFAVDSMKERGSTTVGMQGSGVANSTTSEMMDMDMDVDVDVDVGMFMLPFV